MDKKDKRIDFKKFSEDAYYIYGVAVNEDRSIPCNVDGLKPVVRKSLWAGYKIGLSSSSRWFKSARVVGDVIGKYSPHGDSATYQAIVNNVNSAAPLFAGEGNFGSFNDGPAAMRYTNIRFTKLADKIMFDKFYMPVLDMVSNFDGSEKEPVVLPALLPYLLMNGSSGIGVGVSTNIPSFTKDSVLKVTQRIFKELENHKGKEKFAVKSKYLNSLNMCNSTGGKVDKKVQKESFYNVLKKGKGRIFFDSGYRTIKGKNQIVFDELGVSSFKNPLVKIPKDKDVAKVNDISDKRDKYKGSLEVTFKRTVKGERLEKAIERVCKIMQSATTFDCKVTTRQVDLEKDDVTVKLKNSSIVNIMQDWLDFRIDLEKRACQYWSDVTDKKIRREELLILAVKNMDYLTKLLKGKKDKEGILKDISKKLKVEIEDAEIIIQFRLIQLSKTEVDKVAQKIKDLKAEKAGYQKRIKKPVPHICKTLQEMKV